MRCATARRNFIKHHRIEVKRVVVPERFIGGNEWADVPISGGANNPLGGEISPQISSPREFPKEAK